MNTTTIIPWSFLTEAARERALFVCRMNELRDLDPQTELWVEWVQRKAPNATAKEASEWRALRGFLDDIEHAYDCGDLEAAARLRTQVREGVQS